MFGITKQPFVGRARSTPNEVRTGTVCWKNSPQKWLLAATSPITNHSPMFVITKHGQSMPGFYITSARTSRGFGPRPYRSGKLAQSTSPEIGALIFEKHCRNRERAGYVLILVTNAPPCFPLQNENGPFPAPRYRLVYSLPRSTPGFYFRGDDRSIGHSWRFCASHFVEVPAYLYRRTGRLDRN